MKTFFHSLDSIAFHRSGIFVLTLVLSCCLSIYGCGSEKSSQGDGGASDSLASAQNEEDGSAGKTEGSPNADSTKTEKDKKPKRERTTSVNVARAIRGDLVIPVFAEGSIRSRNTTEIMTEISSRIELIYAKEGQTIRKGQLIIKLDARQFEVAATEARSSYLQALSVLAVEEDSMTVVERTSEIKKKIAELKQLERQGKISREERFAREVALDVEALKNGAFRVDIVAARSGITAARAALERAYLDLERTEIRAPFTGVVTGLNLSDGEQVMSGTIVCSLVNIVDLEAEVGVLESDIGYLDVGRPALLAIPALSDTPSVTVDVISPHFDRTSRTCEVLLRLKNPDGRIKAGMFARAIIAGQTFEDRLLVPREAILTRDGRPLLFKVEGDRAKWLYLKIGKQNDYVVEVEGVLQGGTLSAGDQIVVSNHLTLSHDAKVKVKKDVPINDPWGAKE